VTLWTLLGALRREGWIRLASSLAPPVLCQRAVVRFIVVDGPTDHVCGDFADVELGTASNGDRLEKLCKAAARIAFTDEW
jgi:hypothetical protein